MIEFICLFIPGIFASSYYINKLNIKDISSKVSIYLMYTFIINMIMFIILNYYCDNPYMIFDNNLFSYNFIMKYMVVSLVISLILSIFGVIIKKNIKISFNVSRRNK